MAKIIQMDECLKLITKDSYIVTGMAASEAHAFLNSVHTLHGKVNHITIDTCLPMAKYPFITDAEYKDTFEINSWFHSGDLRKAAKNGNVHFIPNHLHFAGSRRLDHKKPDFYIGNASMPDEFGNVSLSLSNVYEKAMIEHAKTVILEINPNFPFTNGDLIVNESEVDYFIEVDYPVPQIPDLEPNEKDIQIGNHIASLIEDGDCLQLGIGGIPNAVALALTSKKDLGVHTEMLTTGFMKLFQSGAVTNKLKNLHPGKMVACFALGTKELYDFIDHNPDVLIMDGNYVNDPYTICQNDNQVSINTTIEIDLMGQCCSESIGTTQFSGTGGQSDTAVGAQNAKNGRSFIALYSTAEVKDPTTGNRKRISKIVPTLKPGAIVSLSRNDVDYVVTEYGVVRLRGTNTKERIERLISIAHPDYREELKKEAEQIWGV